MDLLIGSRQSDLARLQAYEVGDRLLEKNPGLSIQYHFRQSLGDQNQGNPLWKMPEKGVFTRDFRESLIKGECDLVVHSWKDLPIDDLPGETKLIATLKRADSRDLLLFKKDHFNKVVQKKKLHLFSSSPRRSYNLTDFFKTCFPAPLTHVHFESVRGNILTRVGRLMESEKGDGLILAKAAMDRLLSTKREEFLENKQKLLSFLRKCLWQVLPLSRNPTAAGQGALAIEALSGRDDLKSLFSSIHCPETWKGVCHEKVILKSYGGGCHQKIGVTHLHRHYGNMTFLRGETEQGEILRELYWEDGFSQQQSQHPSRVEKPFVSTERDKQKDIHQKEIYLVRGQWFHPKRRDYIRLQDGNAHFVSRARALPKSEVFDPGTDIVWVSGQKTWEDLAQRGLWVHGSSESMGEREDRRIDLLAQKPLRWLKWAHSQAPRSPGMETVATYDLIPNESISNESTSEGLASENSESHQSLQDLKGYEDKNPGPSDIPGLRNHKALYWRSGSQFQWAVQGCPELLKHEHFCGPGNTFTIINDVLKGKNIKKQPKIIPMEWILKKERSMEGLSRELFKKAQAVSPGGVHSPVRAFKGLIAPSRSDEIPTDSKSPCEKSRSETSFPEAFSRVKSGFEKKHLQNPIFFKKAKGPYLYSCDGNRYVDFCQSFGPLILGHRDPDVSKAVEEIIQTAWTFGTCEPYSLDLAQWIVDRIPHLDKLRFVSSGTEAVMSVLRLARGVTGRHKVIKFEGNYHGHVDSLLVKAGSGLAGAGASDSAGVSEKVASETIVLPMGDKQALEQAFINHKNEIAAVIVEPLPANFGLLKQDKGFLKFLRGITTKEESLLVFDEVISGFRVAMGGMAEISGVEPDLVTYGKIIGGGFPVGCYAGKKQWMDQVAPLGPVYQAGTLSANPVGMVAGLATLIKMEKENVIEKLEKRTSEFVKNLESCIKDCELPLKISHFASLFWIHSSSRKEPGNIREIGVHQKEIFSQLFYHCLKQGLYLAPSAYEVSFLSWSHDEEVLKDSCYRFKKAFEGLTRSLCFEYRN